MKVLHVAETIPGGVASYIEEINYYLEEKKCEVEFILPEEHKVYINRDDCLFHTYNRKGRDFKSLLNLGKVIHKQLTSNNYNVLVVHSSFAGLILRLYVAFFCRRYLGRIVYIPHGISLIMPNLSDFKLRLFRILESTLYKMTKSEIVAVSNYEYELINKSFKPKNIRKIVTTIKDISYIRKSYNQPSEILKVLFVGRFDNEKGLPDLLESMNKVTRKCELTLIGGFSGINNYEVKLNSNHKLCNLGWKSREDISQYMNETDIIIIPSKWEALGLVAIEGLRSGKLLIASEVGGLPEIVEDSYNGYLFPVGDITELAKLIDSITEEQLSLFGLRSREKYNAEFSIDTMYLKLDELFKTYES